MMVQTTVAAGSNNQSVTASNFTLNVASNVGFTSPTGQLSISLTSNKTIAVISYTNTSGTTQFTGCNNVSGTGNLTTNDIVTQSADDGYTVQVIGQQSQRAPASGVQNSPPGSYGLYNSEPAFGQLDDMKGTSSNKTQGPLPKVTGGSVTTYYKMVGYYTTGAVYESFVSTNAPSPPTFTNPNTGHLLVNIYVAAVYT